MERAVIAALALLLGSCLAPQDIEEAEPSTEPLNHAPRIVADQVLVEGLAVPRIYVQSSCDRLRFKVGAVEELDLDDNLEVRFFVDYDRGCEECREIQDWVKLPASQATQALRTTDFEYVLELPPDEGTHIVEAWVSDGFSPAEDALPENLAVVEGKGVDVARWVVEVLDAEFEECLPVAR